MIVVGDALQVFGFCPITDIRDVNDLSLGICKEKMITEPSPGHLPLERKNK